MALYRQNKLGEGTYGIVYGCQSPSSKKDKAVKRNLIEAEVSFVGSIRELDIMAKLRGHPYIIYIETVSIGNPFRNVMMSPLQEKERKSQKDDKFHFVFNRALLDLDCHIRQKPEPNYFLLQRFMIQILLAVEYIHGRKIIHRDLKQSNILIFGNPHNIAELYVQITDFGLAKPMTEQVQNTPCVVTSWYRAPEIALGWTKYTTKSDMWSAGCIIYEMIARAPFLYNVPDDNQQVVSRILGRLPNPLSTETYNKMIVNNPAKVQPNTAAQPYRRQSYFQQFNFRPAALAAFTQAGCDITQFCKLLDSLLEFDPDKRLSATQALDHPFFKTYTNTSSAYEDSDMRGEKMGGCQRYHYLRESYSAALVFSSRSVPGLRSIRPLSLRDGDTTHS